MLLRGMRDMGGRDMGSKLEAQLSKLEAQNAKLDTLIWSTGLGFAALGVLMILLRLFA